MNLIKVGSLTVNLDQVAYWDVIPKEEYEKPPGAMSSKYNAARFYGPSNEPIVVIHFVGDTKPLILWVSPALAFLKLMDEYHEIKDAQLELPPASPSAGGS
jgi:lipopolysaccharide biosynthesis glycosyltransferase